MIDTLHEFIMLCLARPDAAFELFENSCTEDLRAKIYDFADPASPEPFRSAMHSLGFANY